MYAFSYIFCHFGPIRYMEKSNLGIKPPSKPLFSTEENKTTRGYANNKSILISGLLKNYFFKMLCWNQKWLYHELIKRAKGHEGGSLLYSFQVQNHEIYNFCWSEYSEGGKFHHALNSLPNVDFISCCISLMENVILSSCDPVNRRHTHSGMCWSAGQCVLFWWNRLQLTLLDS